MRREEEPISLNKIIIYHKKSHLTTRHIYHTFYFSCINVEMKDFAFVFDYIMPHHHHTDKMFPRPCLYICTICLFVVESDNSVDSVSDIELQKIFSRLCWTRPPPPGVSRWSELKCKFYIKREIIPDFLVSNPFFAIEWGGWPNSRSKSTKKKPHIHIHPTPTQPQLDVPSLSMDGL